MTGTRGNLFVFCLLCRLWLSSPRGDRGCGVAMGLASRLGCSFLAFAFSIEEICFFLWRTRSTRVSFFLFGQQERVYVPTVSHLRFCLLAFVFSFKTLRSDGPLNLSVVRRAALVQFEKYLNQ